ATLAAPRRAIAEKPHEAAHPTAAPPSAPALGTASHGPIEPPEPILDAPSAPRAEHLRAPHGPALPPHEAGTSTNDLGPPSTNPHATGQLGEVGLIQRAPRSMTSNPSLARALVAEHEQRCPDGQFVEEREAIAIEALTHAGAFSEAQARAERFSARFPDSAYA